MNTTRENAPAGAGTPAGANEPVTHKIGDSPAMLDQDVTYEKVTCTGDVWCGCECHACTVSFEHCDQAAPLIVDSLLNKADTLLPTLLASRLASASACFPAPDGGTVYVQFNGNRITIAVTEKDFETQQLVSREFTATITEVTA
ncbi:hypothetical protein ACJH6H_01120 [Mycobacterium sp. SMC-21]